MNRAQVLGLSVSLLALGGRIHIVERVALTLRVGYPGLGIGLSFFL